MNKKLNSQNSLDNNFSLPQNLSDSIPTNNLQSKGEMNTVPKMSELDLRSPEYKCFHFYPEMPKK